MVAIATAPTIRHRVPSRPVLVVLPPVTRPGARVYRRRRLAVLAVVMGLALAVGLLVSTMAADRTQSVHLAPASMSAPVVHEPSAYGASGHAVSAGAVYVVQPGDTIWSIAHE